MEDEAPRTDSDGTRDEDALRVGMSGGASPTWVDDQLKRFLEAGSELPPELLQEQRAVLLRPGDVVAERFEVVDQLGFGGMGAVYRVTDRELHGEEKALKVMLPSLVGSEAARERFLSEVTISQKLRHEGIVTVFDFGMDKQRGVRFLTMEYVPGKTLHRHLADHGGRLPVPEALDIVRQLCDALSYAHKYTIHRDLKPQNIMIRPDGTVKVMDFGLAKLMSPGRMTKSSMALGTAYYQAPEQSVHLRDLDHRADIYSMGVILYQMLTGRIPLGMAKPPSELVPGLPKRLDAVAKRCLQSEAQDRYASAAALQAALASASKFGARTRLVAVLCVLAVTIAALVTGYWVWPTRGEGGAPLAAEQSIPPASATDSPAPSLPPAPVPPEPAPAKLFVPEPAPAPAAPAEPAPAGPKAEEVSGARTAALKAQGTARQAGAEENARELWTQASGLLKEGEAHDTLKAFGDALAKYQAAGTAFSQAETEAKRVTKEVEALKTAQAAMNDAKAKADALDAKTYAKARYAQAGETEQEATAASDRVQSAKLCQDAAGLYTLAVSEAEQQAEAIVGPAKKAAEDAQTRASSDDVKQYCADEVRSAETLMKKATESGATVQQKKEAYEQAAVKFKEAVAAAPARKKAETDKLAREKAAQEQAEVDRLAKEEAARKQAETERLARKKAEEEAKAALPRAGEARTFSGIEMVWIPPGEFMMGSPESEAERQADESPRHQVRIAKGFWLGKTEVTQAQWQSVMGSNPSKFTGDDKLPVEQVSWEDCQEFIRKLNAKGSGGFRLPSESEWEYACRAGTTTRFSFGDSDSGLGGRGWYGSNSDSKTHGVGQKEPNGWGLYDMHGNVWEWCQDGYHDNYTGAPTDGSAWDSPSGSLRVDRGGGWYDSPWGCRSADRDWGTPEYRYDFLGLRLALPAVQ